MRRLKAASLIEAVVASVLFMIVFALSLELLPKLSVGSVDEFATVEVRQIAERSRRKYVAGLWPAGEYFERYDAGCVKIIISPYRNYEDVMVIKITAESGNVKIVQTELAECVE